MSKNSDHVKKWRKNTKDRIIQAMGGSCCICGYNKTHRSMALHHIDPTQKELSFGALRASPKNWDSIVCELRKCVLVCNNCHGEIHDNITQLPQPIPVFDEQFANYRDILRASKTINCPVCGEPMPSKNKTCSLICSGKLHRRFDWDSIDLAELLKTKSYLAIADELGVSDGAVHKRARKLGLK